MASTSFFIESSMRGHHISKDFWTPVIGESFQCELEVGNRFDRYAVMMKKDSRVIGHVPRKISAACYLFIRNGGTILCTVTATDNIHKTYLREAWKCHALYNL